MVYGRSGKTIYSAVQWEALTANPNHLPFKIAEGHSFFVQKKGLADALREGCRVKSFRLCDALNYSYSSDLRFVHIFCLLLGFAIWWDSVPPEVLYHPGVLSSPDIKEVVRVAKDTFEYHICSDHQVPTPCPCGEPLNKAANHLLVKKECFDPLGLKPNLNLCIKYLSVWDL